MTEREPVDVMILMQDLRGGGAERSFLRLARGIVQTGRTVELVLIGERNDYPDEVPDGVTVVVLGCRRVSTSAIAIARYLSGTRPRSVVSALTHVNVVAVAARVLSRHKPRLIVSERIQFSKRKAQTYTLQERIAYALVPIAYRLADAVVCVSDGVADDFRAQTGLTPNKVVTVHNPVFDDRIGIRASEPCATLSALANSTHCKTVVAAGRLVYQKGFDNLISAVAKLRSHMPLRLVILGEGPLRDELKAQARALGLGDADCVLPGFVRNPLPIIASADVFVLSSRYEGFPNALVEAMACGTPIVSTDCPSGPWEIVAPNWRAQLVAVDDIDQLTTEIHNQLAEPTPSEQLVERAARFGVDVAAKSYLEVLGV